MSITHPISDMFTRIRNSLLVKQDDVFISYSKINLLIARILKEEGFIRFYEVQNLEKVKSRIKISLKYTQDGFPVISEITTLSKPGRRVYVKKCEIPKVLNGFGICILSTSLGVLSGRAARVSNVGGELLGIVS